MARSVIEGRLTSMSGLEQVGDRRRRVGRWLEDYGAPATGGVALVARRGGLAGDAPGGSGLRKDGPSMRMVMQ